MRSIPAGLMAAILLAAAAAHAQAPAAPAFAPPNTTAAGVRSMAANCAACHGTQGKAAPGASVPGLAGRPTEATVQAMKDFRDGKRPATVMHQIAKGYSDAEVAAMAEYFARQP